MPGNTVFPPYFLLRVIVLAILLLVVIAGLAEALQLGKPRLIIVCDGRVVASISLEEGPVYVWYNWTHSVEGSVIAEKLLATPHGLILVEARAKSFGAGHPYSSEEIGGRGFAVENGMMIYSANETLGKRLDILAYPDYDGNVTIVVGGAKEVVCPHFVRGTIMVEGRG